MKVLKKNSLLKLFIIIIFFLSTVSISAQEISTIDHNHSLVQLLESRYYVFQKASQQSNPEIYKQTRTKKIWEQMMKRWSWENRLDEMMIAVQKMADKHPKIEEYSFLNCTVNDNMARVLYRKNSSNENAELAIIMFGKEEGLWRVGTIGQIYLHTSDLNADGTIRDMEKLLNNDKYHLYKKQ